jgi:hypothetical protein
MRISNPENYTQMESSFFVASGFVTLINLNDF